MKLARVLNMIDDTNNAVIASTSRESTSRGMRVLVQPLDERLEPVGEAHPAWNHVGARQGEIVVLAQADPASPAYSEEQSTPAGSTVVAGVVDSIEVLARENTGFEKRRA